MSGAGTGLKASRFAVFLEFAEVARLAVLGEANIYDSSARRRISFVYKVIWGDWNVCRKLSTSWWQKYTKSLRIFIKNSFRMGFGEQIHHITQVYCSFSVSARGINELRFLHQSRFFHSQSWFRFLLVSASFYDRTNKFTFDFCFLYKLTNVLDFEWNVSSGGRRSMTSAADIWCARLEILAPQVVLARLNKHWVILIGMTLTECGFARWCGWLSAWRLCKLENLIKELLVFAWLLDTDTEVR